MIRRVLVVCVCLLGWSGLLAATVESEQVPPRVPFQLFPFEFDGWSGENDTPLTEGELAVLRVDEYINRYYESEAGPGVGLYIGYFGSQRQGQTVHSPLNCLPGAGWQPMSKTYSTIQVHDPERTGLETINVNDIVIQKGLDRQVVLYWYQSHGRVVPNEYVSRALMVYDAIRLNRTDAALIRVVSPILPNEESPHAAGERARRFVQAMFPRLLQFLPA